MGIDGIGYKLQVSGVKLQVSGFRLQNTGFSLQLVTVKGRMHACSAGNRSIAG